MTTQAPMKGGFYIPSLDGIRAAAIVLVFVSHCGLSHVVPGGFGVTVFFLLSGYLITTLLRLEYADQGQISVKQFYLRRALRILPPLYLILGVSVLLALAEVLPSGVPDPFGVLAQVLFLANYHDIHGAGQFVLGTDVLWSLAVEEHFYLLFPLLFVFLQRHTPGVRRQVLILTALCLVVLAWRCALVFGMGYGSPPNSAAMRRTYLATDTRLDGILWGCLLALYGNPALDPTRWPETWWKWAFFPAAIVGLLLVFLIRADSFRETFRYSLQSLLLIPVFVTAVRYPSWGPCRPLNWGWVRFLGMLSYTLYLLHHIVIMGVRHWLPGEALETKITAYALAAALSVLLSVVLYYTVEVPFARLRKRLSRVGRPAVTPVVAVT